ncbi:MAG TPA: tetraacyldisaccharide 4'-kinase [Bryobacteraceae bacterium]|nr:tetraacyldisaccharide 4'-kinase [Bryobacteraceae bacterium]
MSAATPKLNNNVSDANDILESKKRVPQITRALLLYRLVQLVTSPLIFVYFAARLLFGRGYRSKFSERLGLLPRPFTRTKSGSIWLHAVSVGEVASAVSLIRQLRAGQPHVPLYLSTGTVAGRKAAVRHAALLDGIFYAPIDYVSCVRRVLRTIRPALVIVLETEIWPNLYYETHRSGARLAIVNGRISNRTWPQYQAWRWFFAPVLQLADAVLVQTTTDFARYSQLSVPPQRLAIAGNLKYDAVQPPAADGAKLIAAFHADRVWIAASTVGFNERGSTGRYYTDEEDIVLRVFADLAKEFPGLLLILAPRQPGRFADVACKLKASGWPWLARSSMAAASAAAPHLPLPGILLLDTIGELAGLYSLADAVFVGGSLAPRGGHNIIEPAAVAAAIVVGPHMQNFEAIARDFVERQAIVQIRSEEELLPVTRDLLKNPRRASDLGKRALQFVRSQQGVCPAIAAMLWPLYQSACPAPVRGVLARAALAPLALLWKIGGALKRNKSERRAASLIPLPVPVISIGGITVGGSGKTPFTNYLASCLRDKGYSPAILTRGYRRRFPAENLIFPPGANVSPTLTGDEAQIFLRAAVAPIGIGAKRYETAQILMRQFPDTNVLVLDDGFQHARIDRDFDIVLIDGLDPFGQEELVPLGNLREPLSALRRAGAFVVTRAENDLRFEAIQERLRKFNPAAPAFRTRLLAGSWHDYTTGAGIPGFDGQRVAAFCGLGNPQNFWNTLESLGMNVVFRWTFDDHHAYKPHELHRLAHQASMRGAEFLVTTEKDRINCPNHLETALAPVKLAWLEIALKLEDEAGFFEVLERVLRKRRPAGLAF